LQEPSPGTFASSEERLGDRPSARRFCRAAPLPLSPSGALDPALFSERSFASLDAIDGVQGEFASLYPFDLNGSGEEPQAATSEELYEIAKQVLSLRFFHSSIDSLNMEEVSGSFAVGSILPFFFSLAIFPPRVAPLATFLS